MNKKTVEDIEVSGKKVLVRCDFNVPLDENGNIDNVIKYTITDEVIRNDSLYLKLRFEKETDTSFRSFLLWCV